MNLLRNGPFLMVVANLFFGFVPVLVRLASARGMPSSEITFIRFCVSCAGVGVLAALGWGKLRGHNWMGLFWRGVFGAFAVLLYFFALQETTAGKGTLLNYTHALWANLFAVGFFHHKPPRGFWLLMAMAGVGVWLVLDPHFQSVNRGDLLGLLSGAFGGGAVLSVKKLRQTDNALTIFASFSVAGLVAALVPGLIPTVPGEGLYYGWIMPDQTGWVVLVAVGLFAMGGQMFFTHAYAFTSIPLGSLMALSVPAMAALLGKLVLDEPLTPHFLLGGALILLACAILGFQEGMNRLDEPE